MDDVKFVDISVSKGAESFASAVDTNGYMYTWG